MHTLIQWGPENVFLSLCPDRRLPLHRYLLPWKQMEKDPLFSYQCCNLSLWFIFHPSAITTVINQCKGREWIHIQCSILKSGNGHSSHQDYHILFFVIISCVLFLLQWYIENVLELKYMINVTVYMLKSTVWIHYWFLFSDLFCGFFFQCFCWLYLEVPKSASFLQIICFHSILFSTSSTLTPTTCMCSLIASINVLYGLPPFLLPGSSILITYFYCIHSSSSAHGQTISIRPLSHFLQTRYNC